MKQQSKIATFFDLDAWQEGHKLALQIYRETKTFPKDELYGVVSQLRRASSSITANLAEGFARFHFKDKVRFYHQARGSAAEVQSFIVLAKDLNYINSTTCSAVIEQANKVGQLINGMIRAIEKQQEAASSTDYGLRVTNY